MRKRQYDVVVVGCGPGGAMAAKFAASNGADTLIIEQKRQIGTPVYDPMGIVNSTSEMEQATGETVGPEVIQSRVDGLRYISLSGKEGTPQILPDAVLVNRQLFEKSLAMGAVRAGAELALHTRVVNVVKEDGAIRGVVIKNGPSVMAIPCSVVIAADGSYQDVARMAGLVLPKGKTQRVNVGLGCEFVGVKSPREPHRFVEIYLPGPIENMYRYVAPYSEDRFGVSCSISRDNVKVEKSLKERLREFTGQLDTTGMYDFSRASPVNMMSGGRVLGGTTIGGRLASDGIILVGDAAGGPLFGCRWGAAGMVRAGWTGRAAGEIAARAIKKGAVSGPLLDAEYKSMLAQTFGEGERQSILEALNVWNKMFTLGPEEQEQAVQQIGWEVAGLHFYSKGGLAPALRSCLEPVQRWLKERGKR